MPVVITKPFYPKTRAMWRDWLTKNHSKKTEIWVVFYKKHTNKPSILYQDSVDEALCFGWIDGVGKSIDSEKYAQRFTPRRKSSHWTDANIMRFKMLQKEGLVVEAGKTAFENKA